MRLILHAGTHKTGTSTIQRVLYDHREALRYHGLFYPDPAVFGDSYRAHHPLAHAVAEQEPESLRRARAFLRDVGAQVRPDEVVLLSAEPVYRHALAGRSGGWWARHRAYLRALARELAEADFDVEVVLVFRRRDEFIESVYHERAAAGFGRPFSFLLERANRLLDYDRQLRQFQGTFPRVTAHRYRDLAGRELVPSFLRALGTEPPPLEVGGWERRSTDARLSLWMSACYREDPDEELVGLRRRFAKNPVAHDLFDDFGRVTLWADSQQRRELLDRYGDHEPIDDSRPAAVLTPEVEARIDTAFDEYLRAKGRAPTRRSARRSA